MEERKKLEETQELSDNKKKMRTGIFLTHFSKKFKFWLIN